MYTFSDDEEITDAERIRMESMREIDKFVAAAFGASGLTENLNFLKATQKKNPPKPKQSRKDSSFHFGGKIPTEIKRSARLANKKPEFSYTDLPEDDERGDFFKRKRDYSSDENDDGGLAHIEDIIGGKKKRTMTTKFAPVPFVAAEDVTESYLQNIAYKGTTKTYSDKGTSCHQCRQKTLDSKTYCRSGNCTGVRGQFCGTCLMNRYGEDARDVLKDPKWACPPCRAICNCSICRNREGKRPTGILFPMAQAQGHRSVKHFLFSLGGKCDYAEQKTEKEEKIEKAKKIVHHPMLGFNKKGDILYDATDDRSGADLVGFLNGKPICRRENRLLFD